MTDYNEGDYLIATIDLKPFFPIHKYKIIPEGAVGIVNSSVNDDKIRFASIKWYSEKLNGEFIGIDTTKGIKKLKNKIEFEKYVEKHRLD